MLSSVDEVFMEMNRFFSAANCGVAVVCYELKMAAQLQMKEWQA